MSKSAAYMGASIRRAPALRGSWRRPDDRASRSPRRRPARCCEQSYASFKYVNDNLRIDALESLRVNDLRIAGIAPALRAAAFGDIGVVVPQMRLRVHAMHRFDLGLEDRRDVQDHVGPELAHLGLVRLE